MSELDPTLLELAKMTYDQNGDYVPVADGLTEFQAINGLTPWPFPTSARRTPNKCPARTALVSYLADGAVPVAECATDAEVYAAVLQALQEAREALTARWHADTACKAATPPNNTPAGILREWTPGRAKL